MNWEDSFFGAGKASGFCGNVRKLSMNTSVKNVLALTCEKNVTLSSLFLSLSKIAKNVQKDTIPKSIYLLYAWSDFGDLSGFFGSNKKNLIGAAKIYNSKISNKNVKLPLHKNILVLKHETCIIIYSCTS